MTDNALVCDVAVLTSERRRVQLLGQTPLTIHEPLGKSKGRVVLVPGWSGPRSGPADLLVFLASRLAAAGWTAVRLDLPGRGDAAGDFAACDLDAMIAAASAAAQAQSTAMFLGVCSGANVALGAVTAIRNPQSELCNAVVALSALPFQSARGAAFEHRRRWKNVKQYAAKLFSPGTWGRLLRGEINLERVKKNVTASEKPAASERNLKDSARDIERELLGWKGPALFVWGGGDEEAPPARAHFEQLHAAGMAAPGRTRFHTIAGANHNFYSRAWREELASMILRFLDGPASAS
jgi:pimeloyl-ACP methyl ester carboxylesterase